MSYAVTQSKPTKPIPPINGSFPLDRTGACKEFMKKYMSCLAENSVKSTICRESVKEYLNCRMDKNLMAKDEWIKLGFHDDNDN